MIVLAIDTATERCSVALADGAEIIERSVDTPRGHADMILPMIDALLAERNLALAQLDGIAYGRGPGAFTGVRIAIGVVQGLAFGAQKLTAGVSNLAAVAQQVAPEISDPAQRILVCMDARMGEVYWAQFERDVATGLVRPVAIEQVSAPEQVLLQLQSAPAVLAGTGFCAYPQLRAPFTQVRCFADALPRARDVALLGVREFHEGRGEPAAAAQPVYLRNQVATVKRK